MLSRAGSWSFQAIRWGCRQNPAPLKVPLDVTTCGGVGPQHFLEKLCSIQCEFLGKPLGSGGTAAEAQVRLLQRALAVHQQAMELIAVRLGQRAQDVQVMQQTLARLSSKKGVGGSGCGVAGCGIAEASCCITGFLLALR